MLADYFRANPWGFVFFTLVQGAFPRSLTCERAIAHQVEARPTILTLRPQSELRHR